MKTSPHSIPAIVLRELLVEKRKNRGLNQIDIAKILSKPQSFVSKYENGERKIDLIDFINICNAIGISPTSTLEEFLEKSQQDLKNNSLIL